jgi:type III secretion protein Q
VLCPANERGTTPALRISASHFAPGDKHGGRDAYPELIACDPCDMTAPPSVENFQPIGGALERVPADAARVSRLAFDARLPRWLRSALSQRELTVTPGGAAHAGQTLLHIETAEGTFQIGLDTAEWPALRMALDLQDDACACAVGSVLLGPWAQALAGAVGHSRIAARLRAVAAPVPALATIGSDAGRFTLHRMDSRLADHLAGALGEVPPRVLADFGGLHVGGRLRLLERNFPSEVLATLRAGDTVLLDANDEAPNVFRTIYGRGATMQFDSQVEPQSGALVSTSPPVLEYDRAESLDNGDASIAELQLPVAFEVDTARITLNELASIQPGYVIELDRPLASAAVRLVCHGQTIGHGQLVAVGDQLGIRIVRMGMHHDAPADH